MSEAGSVKKIESLRKIRLSATMLEVGFKSENLSEIIQCQIELEELAARLQAEQGDLVTALQCEQAKESLDAFVALVDQAMEKASLAEGVTSGPPRPKPTTLGK
jgi:hypothetical protein